MPFISTALRIRKGTSRIPVPSTLTIYWLGVFVLCGAAFVVFGAIVIGIGI